MVKNFIRICEQLGRKGLRMSYSTSVDLSIEIKTHALLNDIKVMDKKKVVEEEKMEETPENKKKEDESKPELYFISSGGELFNDSFPNILELVDQIGQALVKLSVRSIQHSHNDEVIQQDLSYTSHIDILTTKDRRRYQSLIASLTLIVKRMLTLSHLVYSFFISNKSTYSLSSDISPQIDTATSQLIHDAFLAVSSHHTDQSVFLETLSNRLGWMHRVYSSYNK